MFSLNTADRFRRTTAGVALILSPLVFAAAEFFGRDSKSTAAATLADFGAHQGQVIAASLLSIAVAILLLPATLGLVHLIRGRGVTYANLAAICIGYGLIAANAALGAMNLAFAEMASPTLNRPAMAELYDHITHQAAVGAPLLAGHFIFALGILLLAVALLRSHVGPRLAGWLVLGFVLADVILGFMPVGPLDAIISDGCGIVGLVALGLYVLRLTDDQWANPETLYASAPVQTDTVLA